VQVGATSDHVFLEYASHVILDEPANEYPSLHVKPHELSDGANCTSHTTSPFSSSVYGSSHSIILHVGTGNDHVPSS